MENKIGEISNLITEIGLALSTIGWAMLTWFVVIAWLKGDWTVTLRFNVLGEGLFELLLFPALLIITLLANWFYRPTLNTTDDLGE